MYGWIYVCMYVLASTIASSQSVIISMIQSAGGIDEQPDDVSLVCFDSLSIHHVSAPPQATTSSELAVSYQNFIICIEMFLASFAHMYAFPYQPYQTHSRTRTANTSLEKLSQISTNLRAVCPCINAPMQCATIGDVGLFNSFTRSCTADAQPDGYN